MPEFRSAGRGDHMKSREAEGLIVKGMAALDNDHLHLALVCFERAAAMVDTPVAGSGLGYCCAAVRGEVERGVALCRDAVAREPGNVFHYRNLGNVLLLAGKGREAIEVFRAGLRISHDKEIISRLDALGTRKPPVFRTLGREHFLNRTVGLFLSRIGFR